MLSIREARRRAGLTQVMLAERSGLTQQTISKAERGLHDPTWRVVRSIAAALDADPRDLFPTEDGHTGRRLRRAS